MKRILAIALAAIFVLGLAATAMAVDMSGEMRVRGSQTNKDWNDDNSDNDRWYDQRLRLRLMAEAGDTKIYTQMTVSEGVWGMGATTGNVRLDADDYAYFTVPVGPGTVAVGKMPANFGKFGGWGTTVDRVKYSLKAGPVPISIWTTKINETHTAGQASLDYDGYGVSASFKAADWAIGVMITSKNNRAADTTGTTFNVKFGGPIGPASLSGELVQRGGDIYEDAAGNAQVGLTVGAKIPLGPGALTAAMASGSNGFAATGYFTPTLAIGTTQPIALMDFYAEDDSSSMGIVFNYTMPIGDAMNVGATLAQAVVENFGGIADDTTFFETDLTFSYKISDSTSYEAGMYMVQRDDDSGADYDAAKAVGHKIQVNF